MSPIISKPQKERCLSCVEHDGRVAARRGLLRADCPYVDDTEDILEVGYWGTQAAKRQAWLRGYDWSMR